MENFKETINKIIEEQVKEIMENMDFSNDIDEMDSHTEVEETEIEEGECDCNECKGKKTVRMTESQMAEFITNLIKEAKNVGSDENSRNSNEHIKDVEDKVNSLIPKKEPELKQPKEEETTEIKKEVDANKGRNSNDIIYDNVPDEKFKKRIKMSLYGDSKMGNKAEDPSSMTDLAKKIEAESEVKKEAKKKEPLYKKETIKEGKKPEMMLEQFNKISVEMKRMKEIYSY